MESLNTEVDLNSENESVAATYRFKKRDDLHLMRKAWHMATGLLGVSAFYLTGYPQKNTSYLLLGLAFVAFIVEFLRLRSEKFNLGVMFFMGPFMREHEKDSMSGFPFYALGTGLALNLFEERIAVLAILFLIFSDPISSLFGIIMGREKILPNKSLQGSLAGMVTCYLLTLFYLDFYGVRTEEGLAFALIAGIIGAVSELFSIFVDDNLTIPLISGAGLTLLNEMFHVFV